MKKSLYKNLQIVITGLLLSTISINSFGQNNKPLSGEEVFAIVEEMPSFPGGEIEMKHFLQKNIIYPDSALTKGIQGTVYVNFIIEKDGKLSNPTLLRKTNKFLDEEALRVLSLMPAWRPGKQNGKTVRVQFNLPIRFNLK